MSFVSVLPGRPGGLVAHGFALLFFALLCFFLLYFAFFVGKLLSVHVYPRENEERMKEKEKKGKLSGSGQNGIKDK